MYWYILQITWDYKKDYMFLDNEVTKSLPKPNAVRGTAIKEKKAVLNSEYDEHRKA
jgi:hypothetical protein